MCRSGTQIELPRQLAMSQVGLVDDHTLHQPCVQCLSFKSTLALWMPAHWTPSLWPTVAIPQRKKEVKSLPVTSRNACTHTRTHSCLLYDKPSTHNCIVTIYIYKHMKSMHKPFEECTYINSILYSCNMLAGGVDDLCLWLLLLLGLHILCPSCGLLPTGDHTSSLLVNSWSTSSSTRTNDTIAYELPSTTHSLCMVH